MFLNLALADIHPYNRYYARQNPSPCVPDSLIGRVGSGNGGRKIGIVIDASNSMTQYDPDDIRLAASKVLNHALIDSNEATNGKSADLVTVVDFALTANLLYPLGDPAGADNSIGSITPRGGTAIGQGIKTAINELSKSGNDPTANRTGIVVFTDGQDSTLSEQTVTIEEIKRAAGLGIRVSFGFLSVNSENQEREILSAILNTGGIYATMNQADAQQTFIALALAHGLTGIDVGSGNGSSNLLPGLATAAFLSQTGANTFTYAAKAGETINITVTAIDTIDLKVTLRDVNAGSDIKSNTTGSTGFTTLQYTANSATDLEAVITATNTSASGIFSVSLNSSIPLDINCNITGNGSTTQPSSSPTSSQPAQYTGGAVMGLHGAPDLVTAFLVFCFGVAAVVV